MVDNKEQWDEMEEYTEYDDSDAEGYDDGEYDSGADEGYEDDGQYYEDYEDEGVASKKKSNPILGILVFLILLCVAGYFGYTKFFAGKTGTDVAVEQNVTATQNAPQENQQVASGENQSGDMGDFFFSEASGSSSDMMNVEFNDQSSQQTADFASSGGGIDIAEQNNQQNQSNEQTSVAPVENKGADDLFGTGDFSEGQENNAIMVAYDKDSNTNPFKPPVDAQGGAFDSIDGVDIEIIEPPTQSVEDPNLTNLLQTQISGILFDDESPSAVINLGGVDYFVKAGDTVSVYTVNEITKNQVQITYKNNSYVASVGELFVRGKLESQPAIVNLENKFAGRYKNN